MQHPTIEAQELFWDDWIKRTRGLDSRDDPASDRRRDEVVQMLVNLSERNPRILEVGCANGWLSAQLAMYGQVTGIDLAPRSIEEAQARYPHIRFIAGDFASATVIREKFDVVVCVDSLASVADHEAFVGGMARALKPSGWLILTTQNPIVFSRFSRLVPLAAGQVRNWASRTRLRRLLARDFSILQMKTVLPEGDQGFLRIVNSTKLNALANAVVGASRVARLKEWAGLGQTIIVLAQRR